MLIQMILYLKFFVLLLDKNPRGDENYLIIYKIFMMNVMNLKVVNAIKTKKCF